MTQTASTSERILEAARLCFSQFGFNKTAMEDIAREAGVSRGSVYRHFPDKESLFQAVGQEATREFLDETRLRTASVDTLTEQIEEIAELTFTFVRDNPLNAAMVRVDPDAFARLLTTESSDLLSMALDAVVPLIDAAIARGEVRPDLDVRRAAEWITRMVFSLVSTPSVTFDREDPAQRQAFIRDFLVPGLS